ncbi:MAG TPA: thioredoxin reductase, partial [Candidatus Moranbacteria bacterium]|nr:thioredoxin reductase [Candidatus Moranbacteria bacterium]
IGGGDAAATAAIHLTEFANKIYLAYRDAYNWEPSWDEQIEKSGKIEKIKMNAVKEIKGEQKVSEIILDVDGTERELNAQGVFIEVGTTPGVAIAQGLGVELDEQSYIKIDQTQATNMENVFAAGDVTTGSNKFRQIITA